MGQTLLVLGVPPLQNGDLNTPKNLRDAPPKKVGVQGTFRKITHMKKLVSKTLEFGGRDPQIPLPNSGLEITPKPHELGYRTPKLRAMGGGGVKKPQNPLNLVGSPKF